MYDSSNKGGLYRSLIKSNCPCFVIFLIWQCSDIYAIAIHAFPKINLNIIMVDFEVNNKIILGGFISIDDRIYLS